MLLISIHTERKLCRLLVEGKNLGIVEDEEAKTGNWYNMKI